MRATPRTPSWIAVLAPAIAASCDQSSAARPEHVLLVLVDTLRADHLGSLGHPRSSTPAIDSVAARGVIFEEAYAQSSWTSPSVVALFTGRRLAEDRLDLPAALPTLAESFQRAGFATGAFIMNDLIHEKQGFARGFDHFVQMVPYSENTPILEWLAARGGARSFTYVHLNEVHDPYVPPEGYLHWRKSPDPLPPERRRYYEQLTEELALQGDLEAEVRHIETECGGYLDEVRYADERIGGLLAGIEALGLAERTCVAIVADHGEGLWTRVAMMAGQRRKALESGAPPSLTNTLMPTHGNQVHRELLHVPWVMGGPGLPAGARVAGPVELVDLFPTLLELCGLPTPAGLQGTSRLSSIRGSAQPPAEVFAQTRYCSTLITADGWQVIVPTELGLGEERLPFELYHLQTDPEAHVNRACDEPELLKSLVARALVRRAGGVGGSARASSLHDDPDLLERLRRLGYLDGGVVDPDPAGRLPLGELVERVASGQGDCPTRLVLASALAARRDELDSTAKQVLRARLALETSAAVRAELEQALE